ncbi:MAG: lamin tail domain-containing protein [Lentisphaerae bacterium]|nr:lamin tail domain-containing protein [Lentisphaerota bacterium]
MVRNCGALFLAIAIAVVPLVPSSALAALEVGDVQIVGYRSAQPDCIAFVTWTNLPGGTDLVFTDSGWLSAGGFRSGEGCVCWTAPADGLRAGSVVVLTNLQDSAGAGCDTGTVQRSGAFGLSTEGDQVFITNATCSLVFGLDFNGADRAWDPDASSASTSALPPPLSAPGGNLAFRHADNGQYSGKRAGSAGDLRAAVLNAANWTFDNTGALSLDSTDFSVGAAVPMLTVEEPSGMPWVGNAIEYATVRGSANAEIAGTISWSNRFTGAAGVCDAGHEWSFNAPLEVGTNVLMVTGTNGMGEADAGVAIIRRMAYGGAGPLVISEFMCDPAAVADNNGEWLEIYNRGESDVDIGGWSIGDLGTDRCFIAGPLTVPAGGFVVLGVNADPDTNGGVPVECDWGSAFDFQLANAQDELLLLDPGGGVACIVEYGGEGTGWQSGAGRSLCLSDPSADPNDPANWIVAAERLPGYQGEAGDCGSPGGANETGSWGARGAVFIIGMRGP